MTAVLVCTRTLLSRFTCKEARKCRTPLFGSLVIRTQLDHRHKALDSEECSIEVDDICDVLRSKTRIHKKNIAFHPLMSTLSCRRLVARNAPAAALGAHRVTGSEGESPVVSLMPARRCVGRIKEDGSVEACCFNGRSVGQPANALTEDGCCVWCSPAEMHRRIGNATSKGLQQRRKYYASNSYTVYQRLCMM